MIGLKLFTSSGSPARPCSGKFSKTSNSFLTLTSDSNNTNRQNPPMWCLHRSDSHFIYQCHKFCSVSLQKFTSSEKSQYVLFLRKFWAHITCLLKLKCKVKGCGSLSHNTTLQPSEIFEKYYSCLDCPSSSTSLAQGKYSAESCDVKTLATFCMKSSTKSLNQRSIYLGVVPV